MNLRRRFAYLAWTVSMTVVTGCATSSKNGEPSAVGIDREKVRRVVRDHLVPIRHCYEKELKKDSKIGGKLKLGWDINDEGRVTKVDILQSVHPAVDTCVADSIREWSFPAPPKGQTARVIYPFLFSSSPTQKTDP